MNLFQQLVRYLGRVMGEKTAYHVLLRFCTANHKTPEQLSSADLAELGKYLRENLSFFVGASRAQTVQQQIVTQLQSSKQTLCE